MSFPPKLAKNPLCYANKENELGETICKLISRFVFSCLNQPK